MSQTFQNLIPHSGPMLLLSRIISVSENQCVCESDIDENNIFATAEGIPNWAGSELIAQAVAAYGGSHAKSGSESKIGFLLGVRKYRCEVSHFKFDQTLSIRVEPVMTDDEIGTYAGKIFLKEQLIAEGTLTILKPSQLKLEKMRPA